MHRFFIALLLLLPLVQLAAAGGLVETFIGPDGRSIDKITVPGIPEEQRVPGPIAVPSRNTVLLSGVPAFNWCYGCSATSAAMMAGYYDRHEYGHIYTGPANGGVMPLNNSIWGYGECTLSATHQGYDGLATAGHVDRFWVDYGDSGNDPFGGGDPTSTYWGCTTDYMGTNQDWWGNSDGATTFWNYTNGSPLHDYTDCEDNADRSRDGTHGMKLFFESRGYSVSTNYNQYIYGHEGNTIGFTYTQYKNLIDAGIPVIIQVSGHSMLGVGYESTSSTIYIHDTWDHNVHTMNWGGSYSNMQHYGVSVVQLDDPPTYTVSGTILSGGTTPLGGVAITATGGYATMTNSNGQYSISVPYWWTGTVIPSKAGYVFTPQTRDYADISSNSTGQNYTAWDVTQEPQNISIQRTPTQLKISWDPYGTGVYRVYAFDDPADPALVNVSSQGTFSLEQGRVVWTASQPAAQYKFYHVRVYY